MVRQTQAILFEQSFRPSENDPWVVLRVLATRMSGYQAIRKEGNLDHTKMRFPLRANTNWDPTQFFDPTIQVPVGTELIEQYSNWNGTVLSIDQPESIGPFSFPEVLTVQQADDDNEIERRFSHEKYAKDVGLVLRIDTILDSRCKRLGDLLPCLDEVDGALVSQPWEMKAEKGYILHKEIVRIN